ARLEDGASCEARVWDLETGRPTLRLPDHSSLALAPDGKLMAAAEMHGAVKVWTSPARDRELFALPPQPGIVNGLVFSRDSSRLAVSWMGLDIARLNQGEKALGTAMTTGVAVWDTRTGKEVR